MIDVIRLGKHYSKKLHVKIIFRIFLCLVVLEKIDYSKIIS